MKDYITYILFAALALGLWACGNDQDIDTKHSIFPTDEVERNAFDMWVLDNYTNPFNIELKYRMEDNESDMDKVLIPAEYDKSVALAKIVKHVWMDAYTEIKGVNFLRTYVPKTLHFIGSPGYNDNNTMVIGSAEGGMKITLYNVNYLDMNNIDMDLLNEFYFGTMHHEFGHILHQTKNYDPSFKRITESDYVGGDWYMNEYSDNALALGFVSPYSRNLPDDDFVEIIAVYVTHDAAYWASMLQTAGASGAAIINKKFAIVYNYMRETWGVDLNKMRSIVLRRQKEINDLDLSTIK